MQKEITFDSTWFQPEVVQAAVERIQGKTDNEDVRYASLQVSVDGAFWAHDKVHEFWPDYRRSVGYVHFSARVGDCGLIVSVTGRDNHRRTRVSISTDERSSIEDAFNVFEAALAVSRLPTDPGETSTKVFIGHGGSNLWRELRDHLRDSHGIDVVAYEIGSRAGHGVRDILESMLADSSMAFLIMTGEDETAEELFRARQNVVHELGLFQGRLGFARAIAVVEQGTELFSNLAGIQQLRFSKGNIKEIFGDVVATVKREFGGP